MQQKHRKGLRNEDDNSAGQNNFKIQLKLEDNEQITLAVGCQGNQTGSFRFYASRNGVLIGAEPITKDSAISVEIQNRQRERYYVFTAEQEGYYVFSHSVKGTKERTPSSLKYIIELFEVQGSERIILASNDTDQIENDEFLTVTYHLAADQKIYILESFFS